jgi:hypothetical protein
MDLTYSKNNVPIRLTEERWFHIVSNKPYMERHYENILKAIAQPTRILRGYAGALVAIVTLSKQEHLHVVYKEVNRNDGFVITAFIARKVNKRAQLWP